MTRQILVFLVRRLGMTVLLLLALSLLVYGLMFLAPGDIARNLLGTRNATPQALDQVRAQYHLDKPFLWQYTHWLSHALTGDFGTSIRTGAPVGRMMRERLGLTAAVSGLAFLLSVLAAVPAGVVAALHRGEWLDRALVGWSVVGISAPGFAVGLILLYVFAVGLGWFPVYGTGSGFLDSLWHLVLPAVTLALGLGAFVVKLTRAAVARELDEDYVVFARSRGLGRARVLGIVLRNAAVPVLTSLALMVGYLFGGTLLAEVTFALPGLGALLEQSVLFKDFPVVQALTVVVAVLISLTALLADLAYLTVDPRIRNRMAR
ncbi:ABC transporter permease [Streptomyces hygroscopicus subsp. hygroscopicus]|uniref:ABC transporter permease n=1 Tax=Streptomyces sp. KHY 26 TaxID=3097359 RepID=UPI0024A1D4C8|nr:ABC transporter permease [Streptomyces hygroscopicus]GLX47720.1 ABC transporter permease [Streptomyces hygroscopicus subsp. hygroscopicus]